MYPIIDKRQLTPVTAMYVIMAPLVARSARAGQFVILRVGEGGERIPVTIVDFDPAAGTITLVVQAVGKTTHWLATLGPGDALADVAGPLGNPAELPRRGHAVLVGGGFGAGALYTVAAQLVAGGVWVSAIVGARTADLLIMCDELGAVVDRLYPCTDDGSAGFKGFVTERLRQVLDAGPVTQVIAVGPMPMMRAVAEVTRGRVYTQVSLDPIMLDGTGMCGACRCSVGGETRFACVDGPFFDAHAVDFDELVRRNRMYRRHEQAAMELYAGAGERG